MEDFAIDLDKVLDDFEISEGTSPNPPPLLPLASKPSPIDDLDLTEANFAPAQLSKLEEATKPTDGFFVAEDPLPTEMHNGAVDACSRPELLHNMDIDKPSEELACAVPSHSQPDVVPVTLTPVLDVREASCHCEELLVVQPEQQLRDFLQGKHGPHVHAGGDVQSDTEEATPPDNEHAQNSHEADTNHSYSVLDDAMPSLSSQEPTSLPPVIPEPCAAPLEDLVAVADLVVVEDLVEDKAVLKPAEVAEVTVPCENGHPHEEDVEAALKALEESVEEGLIAPEGIEAVVIAGELSVVDSPELRSPVLPTPERRSSGGSIERFLNPNILSPSITTPVEDSGMSKVPGFTPDLDSMVEVKEEDEEEHQAASEPSCVRPKQPPAVDAAAAGSSGKRKRPNSLLGLSTPDFSAMSSVSSAEEATNPHDEINRQIAQQCSEECNVDGEKLEVANVNPTMRQIQPPNTLVGLSIPMQDDDAVLPARPNSLNLSVNSNVSDLDPKLLTPEVSEMAAAESASVASLESLIAYSALPEELRNMPSVVTLPSDAPPPPMSANVNMPITHLGRFAPIWLPDAEAANCMQCETKFTFTKRRHHCRACGKVFCSTCCNLKSRLGHLDGKEARVCSRCYQDLVRAQVFERMHAPDQSSQPQVSPNPNNPSEYCSTIPPMQQVQANAPPPTVMVPSTVGVLRKQGSVKRNEPKQVMFSDGIRPGGDLTELDGSSDVPTRLPSQRTGRKVKVVERSSEENTAAKTRTIKSPEATRHTCLIPEMGLPPVILQTGVKGDYSIEENPDVEKIMAQIHSSEDDTPTVFAINKNLFVIVKIVSLECCVNRVCWNFTTKGMCTVNQAEVIFVLECLPDEKTIPRDIFTHLNSVYEEASRGNPVSHLSHVIFSQPFLESRDHGGVLYMQPTFQCQQKLVLPSPPYLYGILLQKWETPWAKIFPLRLMLRLGAEFRYYPCPLISVRFRKPVYGEIGHTIMNLLADFRNYQYMLPTIKGVTVHMENKWTYVNFPRNRYDQVMKVVNSSNDHVMALGANFSSDADSHLICYQNDEGTYQTQAINIQNKPRQVTGASFVVFNGALKNSAGMRAKSSIVEDGVMVQITAESLAALKDALKDMQDYTIPCGSFDLPQPDEHVKIQWVDDDKRVNIGVVSAIDGMSLEGIESIQIHHATDYAGEKRAIRWTECFFIKNEDQSNPRFEPVDQSRLAETLAQACCIALTKHLDALKEAGLAKIALRANIDSEQVGYEVGSNGARLPVFSMNDLDSELIPVIHNAASHTQDGPVTLELVFHIVE